MISTDKKNYLTSRVNCIEACLLEMSMNIGSHNSLVMLNIYPFIHVCVRELISNLAILVHFDSLIWYLSREHFVYK